MKTFSDVSYAKLKNYDNYYVVYNTYYNKLNVIMHLKY